MSTLPVNREQIATFVQALFKHATGGGFVQMRAFIEGKGNEIWRYDRWRAIEINGCLDPVIDAAESFAQECADAPERVVFCPPVTTFKGRSKATEAEVQCGLTLGVDLDANPERGLETLENILGPATLITASGGEWVNPETGEVEKKLHVDWRLANPATDFTSHTRLKESRRAAAQIIGAGADTSAIALVHPMRWPGSWHRKGEPRLSRILTLRPDVEIDLDKAFAMLREVAERTGAARGKPEDRRQHNDDLKADDFFDIAAALSVIPNDNVDWPAWNNKVGLATWAASGGAEFGFAAFDAWSSKSSKYDATETRARWDHFAKHPPDRIGFGTLVHLAREAQPGWRKPSDAAKDWTVPPGNGHAQGSASGGNSASGTAEPDSSADDDTEDFSKPPPPPPPEPQPKIREFPVLAEEAFIGLPGDIVRAVAPHTESDPAGLLLSALVFFGNCVGRGPHYRVEATQHGPNLYVVKVGDSSKARKGTGEDRIMSFFRHVDEEWARGRMHTGLSSGEGVIWAVRDPIMGLVRDKKEETVTQEVIDPGIEDKRLLVIESEFAGALRVMGREGNILSRVLRDGWDRGDLATLTKNAPARATGACVSLVGHVTAPELRTYFDRTEMANGFGNRFLFACVRRSKLLPFGGNLHEGEIRSLAYRIRHAVNAARSIHQVVMAAEAASAWRAIYADLSADRPGLLGSLTARAEAQVVRLAMLYALWAESDHIALDHLMAAVAVEQFCRDSVEYLFGDTLGDPVTDTVLDALRAAGAAGLTLTEISNLFSRNVSVNQIARALGELARRGLAMQRRSNSTSGRPPETWVAIVKGEADEAA